MPRRINLGRAAVTLGAALLFISLFLRWYDTGLSGWEAFELADIVLAALAGTAAWAALRGDELPDAVLVAAPAAALAIVVVQLVNDPPAAAGAKPELGAWLALGATLAMVVAAALSRVRVAVTVEVSWRPRRRVAAVDRRPAPPAATEPNADDPPAPSPRRGRGDVDQPTQPFTAVSPEAERKGDAEGP